MSSINEPLLLGSSSVLEQLRSDIHAAARSDARVLIEGETGVGKDVAARLMHWIGRRRAQRFVAVNCAGLPDALLESELFGHVRGSFTGAYRDKSGLAVVADGGTLFLDEVGEMSPRMQAVLLRFTEHGEVHPVGSDRPARTVDVRLIAATNRPLARCVASGDFRSDLFYRLNVVRVTVPPLRERGSDVIVLLKHFICELACQHAAPVPVFTDRAIDALLHYCWPGNIRELRNLAEQLVVKSMERPVDPTDLPPQFIGLVEAQPLPAAGVGRLADEPSAAAHAWNQMVEQGQTFWTAVYDAFMEHELTKADVRIIVKRGLHETHGSYRELTDVFHLTTREYRRFLAFLHQHDCHVSGGSPLPSPDTDRSLVKAGHR